MALAVRLKLAPVAVDAAAGAVFVSLMPRVYSFCAYKSTMKLDLYAWFAYSRAMRNAKSERFHLRLSLEEKDAFSIAADLAGIPLSAWVRERLRLAAIRDLEGAGRSVPFVSPVRLRSSNA